MQPIQQVFIDVESYEVRDCVHNNLKTEGLRPLEFSKEKDDSGSGDIDSMA